MVIGKWLFFGVMLAGLLGALWKWRTDGVREVELRKAATLTFNAAKDGDEVSSLPESVTQSCWKSLVETQDSLGKLESYEIEEVYVPFVGVTDSVIVRTLRRGKRYKEMLVSVGTKFYEHQLIDK